MSREQTKVRVVGGLCGRAVVWRARLLLLLFQKDWEMVVVVVAAAGLKPHRLE
jgi:hypothetical protein